MALLSDSISSDDSFNLFHPSSRDSSDTAPSTIIPSSDSPPLQALISKQDQLVEALDVSPSDANVSTDEAPNTFNQSDVPTLIKYIDEQCHSIFPDWSAPLCFKSNQHEIPDITRFANKKYKKSVLLNNTPFCKQYFCKTTYPPNDGLNGKVFAQLCKDICRSAIYSGFEVFKNGKYPAKYLKLLDCQRFSCCKCRTFVSQRSGRADPSAFRKTSYHQDKLNTRGSNGKKMPRRSNTKRTKLNEHKCRYYFLVHYDADGFLLFLGLVKPITSFTPSLDIPKFNYHQGCWTK